MIKLLLGGSPCTHWSIAQTKNRETKAEGIGWELFLNYVIAKEKFQPDYFLYENNWSASFAIKEQIQAELGCKLMRINSSLVSAQSRDRFYVFNWDIEQPKDRQICLSDILESGNDVCGNVRSYCLTASYGKASLRDSLRKSRRTMVAMPVRLGTIETSGVGAKTGLYAVPTESQENGTKIYTVTDGKVDISGKLYPIRLADGQYAIRKLTPIECERLQTMPDNYTAGVSNAQRYKCLGNGWTAEVIIHILNGALKNVPRDEKIVVLSMYDGIATGRYCLDKMGFKNVEYHAYEIDKYAITVAMSNYPDIIQHGDAFDIRKEDWRL